MKKKFDQVGGRCDRYESMNILKSFLILWLCFFYSSWARDQRAQLKTHDVVVKKGEVFQSVKFPEGTRLTVTDQGNVVVSATLSKDFQISGFLIKQNTAVRIGGAGALVEIETEDGQKINNLIFTKGEASIRFTPKGAIEDIFLRRPKSIDGYMFADNYHVQFHPSGKISIGQLSQDQVHEGFNLKGKTEIRFFPSGQLMQIQLAKSSAFGDLMLIGAAEFWSNGKLKAGTLAASAKRDGFQCGPGSISFFESGKLQTLILGNDRTVILNPYAGQAPVEKAAKAGDSLNMNESGTVIGWGSKR